MPSLLTIWAYEPDRECVHSYEEATRLIKRYETFDTTQMCLLNEPQVHDYDYVVIVDSDGVTLLANDAAHRTWSCIYTDRELRRIHNLLHLWRAGEFRHPAPNPIWIPAL